MRCAWTKLLDILPQRIRSRVDGLGRQSLQEIRLRSGQPPCLICSTGSVQLEDQITVDDLHYVVNTASKYSPWASWSSASGYITAPGGHRIGMCGEAIINGDELKGIRKLSSLCIRVARDFDGLASSLVSLKGSVLIIGRPGDGKTTLLRDLIRQRSRQMQGSVGVVDERGEIFPDGEIFPTGPATDVLCGCPKSEGMDILIRTMGPRTIAVDEITSEKDCDALVKAGWCGVDLIATAHAASGNDLYTRTVYRSLVQNDLFDHLVVLRADKSYVLERVKR